MLIEVICDGASRGQGQRIQQNTPEVSIEALNQAYNDRDYDKLIALAAQLTESNHSDVKTGEAACGVIIKKNGKEIARFARGLGKRTNNEAEYEAVICALLVCSIADLPNPILYSDSLLVINQVTGKWKCNTEALRPLLKTIHEIQKEYKFRLVKVPRNYVREADNLAKQFLNELAQEKPRSDFSYVNNTPSKRRRKKPRSGKNNG